MPLCAATSGVLAAGPQELPERCFSVRLPQAPALSSVLRKLLCVQSSVHAEPLPGLPSSPQASAHSLTSARLLLAQHLSQSLPWPTHPN